ncbi:MAG: PilZ domain-containing protein [Cyanobium sp.]
MAAPGFLKFLQDRRAAEQAAEAQAALERRTLSGRRQHPRHPIPFGVGAPAGRMVGADGTAIHVQLWDVSEGGVCVLSRVPIPYTTGAHLQIELQSGVGVKSASLEGVLTWVGSDQRFGHFAGLRFDPDKGLPNGSFLDRYLTMRSTGY